jgi:tetratricopeptide (TPR) repeat protein
VRLEPARPPEGPAALERDTRIEDLLLAGLDHYFAGEFELAITVWTRVLFFDRAHARARAYIDRARSAMAERQRESDELLHEGMAAFHRGEGVAARDLLTSAIARGGNQDVAQAFLDRLDRLQGVPPSPEEAVSSEPSRRPRAADREHRPAPRPLKGPIRLWPLIVVALLSGAAMFGAASRDLFEPLLRVDRNWRPVRAMPPPSPRPDPLPIARAADVALAKAQALYAAGRLADALRMVETIRSADPLFPEAARLRARIQQALFPAQ